MRTLQNAFYKDSSLKSVNLSSVESDDFQVLSDMFYDCHSLEYIYLPKTNYKNSAVMDRAFTNCYSLKSINLSSYSGHISSLKTFEGCTNLSYIDMSSFDTATENLFKDLPKTGEIKLNKRAFNGIKDQIPEDWIILLIK